MLHWLGSSSPRQNSIWQAHYCLVWWVCPREPGDLWPRYKVTELGPRSTTREKQNFFIKEPAYHNFNYVHMKGRPGGQRHPRVMWRGDTVLAPVGAGSWRRVSGSVKEWPSQKGVGKAVPFNSSWDIFFSTFLSLQ